VRLIVPVAALLATLNSSETLDPGLTAKGDDGLELTPAGNVLRET
jgi:hypothetical protein